MTEILRFLRRPDEETVSPPRFNAGVHSVSPRPPMRRIAPQYLDVCVVSTLPGIPQYELSKPGTSAHISTPPRTHILTECSSSYETAAAPRPPSRKKQTTKGDNKPPSAADDEKLPPPTNFFAKMQQIKEPDIACNLQYPLGEPWRLRTKDTWCL